MKVATTNAAQNVRFRVECLEAEARPRAPQLGRGILLQGEIASDQALMERYQKGDVKAFEQLLRRHRRPVYNFLLRHVGSAANAEELLQETFLRVIKTAKSYAPRAKFTTWLFTIARNLSVDHARRAKHRNAASLEQTNGQGGRIGDRVANGGQAVDEAVIGKEAVEEIESALESLEDEQREVFLMREYLDMPFKEIAAVVGCSENTVKSRMRYAMKHLRRRLSDYRDMVSAAR